jgi:drug/metabolite transporter (DMT)-like permease
MAPQRVRGFFMFCDGCYHNKRVAPAPPAAYTPTMTAQRQMSMTAWALLGLLAIIWGGSYLSNRIALEQVPVFTTVAFRVAGAALALWVYVLLRRLPLPLTPGLTLRFLVMGVVNNVIPFTLIVWGQQHIPSGLAAILNAATAILSVLLAALLFADERLTTNKAVGVAVGFVGVVVIVGPDALTHLDITSWGQLAMLGAAVSYAVSSAFARVALRGLRPEVSAAGMLTASALVMVPLALWQDGVPTLTYGAASWGALVYLALMSSALAYVIFYRVLTLAGAGNLQLVTLLVGPVAVGMGAVVYGEALAANAYAGFAIIAMGLVLIDGRILRRFSA